MVKWFGLVFRYIVACLLDRGRGMESVEARQVRLEHERNRQAARRSQSLLKCPDVRDRIHLWYYRAALTPEEKERRKECNRIAARLRR